MYRYWQRSCGVLPGALSAGAACGGEDGGVCAPAGTIAPIVINNVAPSKPRIAICSHLSLAHQALLWDVPVNRHTSGASGFAGDDCAFERLEQRQFALAASKA